MAQDSKVRFVRIRWRIFPIREKAKGFTRGKPIGTTSRLVQRDISVGERFGKGAKLGAAFGGAIGAAAGLTLEAALFAPVIATLNWAVLGGSANAVFGARRQIGVQTGTVYESKRRTKRTESTGV